MAMLKSIQILLAIVAYYDHEIWQMDVKTIFLNGELKKDMYMTQQEGFTSLSDHNKVCKLQTIHLWIETSFQKLEHSL